MSTQPDQAIVELRQANAELVAQRDAALASGTALADVLELINRSPRDLRPVFDAILEKALKLCNSAFGILATLDGEFFQAVATRDLPAAFEEWCSAPISAQSPVSALGRIARGEAWLQVADLADTDLYRSGLASRRAMVDLGGARSVLWVGLKKDDIVLGKIAIYRKVVRPYTAGEITLLRSFAAQAVIAMENARLLREQQEALEQQTAIADVLKKISQSTFDLQQVLDTVVETAARLCAADLAHVTLRDGDLYRPFACFAMSPEFDAFVRNLTFKPGKETTVGRVLLEARAVQQEDISADPNYAFREAVASMGNVRSHLGVPLGPVDDPVGVFVLARTRPGRFTDKQVELVKTFADQAVIAIGNARLMTETREALEQQTATAEVLQVINANPGHLPPVFETLLEKAMALTGAAFGELHTYDGERYTPAAIRGANSAYVEARRKTPPTSRAGTGAARILETKRTTHVHDLREAAGYRAGDAGSRTLVDIGGARTALAVPLLREGTVNGLIMIYRQEVRPFSEKQTALLEGFAAQAVIAMNNARLLTEQQEALERQTATAELLQTINRNPGNLTPVFDAILEQAHRLCGAPCGSLQLYDGEHVRAVAARGMPESFVAMLRAGYRPDDNAERQRMLDPSRPVLIADAAEVARAAPDDAMLRAVVEIAGLRTMLLVPLCKDDTYLGRIVAARQEVRPFTDKQIALLESFAAQAVIAIENARLLTEQREALERQTAAAEVLQAINANPGNLTPVFETLLDKTMTLCGAAFGEMYSYDDGMFIPAALRGLPPAFAAARRDLALKMTGAPGSVSGRLRDGESVVHIADVRDSDLYRNGDPSRVALVDLGGARTSLGLALRKDGVLLGVINMFRQEVRLFSDKQIGLLQDFAAQAVIAIENAQLLNEVRQRQEELHVTFENMSDGVAMFDEAHHLVAWNRNFQDILDVPDEVLTARQTYEHYIRYLTARGEFGPDADPDAQIRRLSVFTRQSTVFERTRPNGRVIEVHFNPIPTGGFVLIYTDITARKRNEEALRAARDAAEEASRSIEAAYSELKIAQANLIQAEKMASLGQLTAGIAHEIKNPLNFVNNFSSLSVELLAELKEAAEPGFAALDEITRADIDELTETLTDNLTKITEHGKRADGIVRSMLEHSRGASGDRRMVDLNALVDEALNLTYHGARAQDPSFNITLERDYGSAIAPVELNPQDMTRVCLNLIGNGFYATHKRQAAEGRDFEPCLKVTTRDVGDAVEIRVRDNGSGIPKDIRDKLFEPFFTTKPTGEGTGLGLSISYDIVRQQHGGTITVDSEPSAYTEFTVHLPRTDDNAPREQP